MQADPKSATACLHLGVIAYRRQDYHLAERMLQQSVDADPANAAGFSNLSVVLKYQGKLEQALNCIKQALLLRPDNPDLLLNQSAILIDLDKLNEAVACCQKILQAKPDSVDALGNLAAAYRKLKDPVSAIRCYQQAVALDPKLITGYNELISIYDELKIFDAVSANCLKALALEPANPKYFFNLGLATREQGDLQASARFLQHACSLMPESYNIRFALGTTLLALGDLKSGWNNFEARWYKEAEPVLKVLAPFPPWQGESLEDKVIFVWGEQGLGDQIMFASMYEDLVSKAKLCVFACADKLMPLFQRSFPKALIVNGVNDSSLEKIHIDVQSAAGSLAQWLRADIQSFPRKDVYLIPNQERVSFWGKKLRALGPELKVGISWRSGVLSGDRGFYGTSIEQWGPIFKVPGVTFINLQYDECAAELARAKQLFSTEIRQFPEVDLLNDLDETAALTQALDLVISAWNTSAILAAATGVPTWIMHAGFNWQKFGTPENCWYAGMRSFEKNWDQDWSVLIEEIAGQLLSKASC